MKVDKLAFKEGLRDGTPIGLGYFAVAFSLGIKAKTAGLNWFQGFLASATTYASAGEAAAFTLIAENATYIQMVLMILIANGRYLLMSCALSQRFSDKTKFCHRPLLGIFITDELFGINITRKGNINPAYFYGAILACAPAWAVGTAIGVVSGNILPVNIVSALGVAIAQTLSCAACHRQARCARCTGPLEMAQGVSQPRCRWCAAAAVNWVCPHCHGDRMRVVRVGAAGTVQELHGLFRNVPMVVSSPHQPQGVVTDIANAPMLVIATPGAEPRVRARGGGVGQYQAVAILDAWTSLYAPGVDARVDALDSWMRVVQWCAPRSAGGQALLIGEADPQVAQSLMTWNARLLAVKELEERAQTGLPPVVTAACVWGARPAVRAMLQGAGLLAGGDWALLDTAFGPMPAVLGPVPIPPPRTVDARELETMADRVKAVVRVSPSRHAELAERLHRESARHVASREPGELRFQLDPKDLI